MSLPDTAEYWWDVKGWSRTPKQPSTPHVAKPPVHWDDKGDGKSHFCRTGADDDPVLPREPFYAEWYGVTCRKCRRAVNRRRNKCKVWRDWHNGAPNDPPGVP